ncbi:glycosyltransferase [Glaciecola sp. XM2]|uniref:glycosyltransferase n=1 Tax=Glaciecola sp. XM2 TaxID=1914931 RepID=UPI001BDE23DF|nr:glycosyltransferase [Glaciecola sp. XM2]MBT1450701.1 glycosyltransferase [Glaciecola sp. XM2]
MNNLHISLTEFKNESRVLKQVNSLSNADVFRHIHIVALHEMGLDTYKKITDRVFLRRIRLRSREFGSNLLSQIIKYFEFWMKVFLMYRREKISVVTIHSSALLPIGVSLKLLFRCELVYDAHELETERNGLKGLRKILTKINERFLIPYVSKTIVVSESIAHWYEQNYKMSRPLVVLNSPPLMIRDKNNHFKGALNIEDNARVFLYQGILSKGRGIELIVNAFESLVGTQNYVVFMGYGPLKDYIESSAASCKNIFYHPAVPPDEVLNYTCAADYGLSLIENTCLSYYYCMPNKMFEYTMAGIPSICSNMLEMARYVNDNGVGFILKEFSSQGLVDCINELPLTIKASFYENCKAASEKYCWESQENKLNACYRQLASGG